MRIDRNKLFNGEFFDELENTINYEERTRYLDHGFLTIDELIEELQYLKEAIGGDATVHLLDRDEQDAQLDDVSYVPLGILFGKEIDHIKDVKAGLIVTRTKDYYRIINKINKSMHTTCSM